MSFAILCPGQGGQGEGLLAQVLADAGQPAIGHALEDALGMSAAQIKTLSLAQLRENRIAQPCITAFQLTLWEGIAAHLPRPALAAGYSLGELIASACAGALSPQAAVALARVRATLMDDTCAEPTTMLALRGLRGESVAALARGEGWFVALRNGADRFVVAGPESAAKAVAARAVGMGAQVTPLAVTTPSHTPMLQAAVAPFEVAGVAALTADPEFPVLCALDGSAMRRRGALAQRLARALAEPLDWAACMDALVERGMRVCLELGPGADLARMMNERHPGIACRSVAEFVAPEAACHWVRAQMETAPGAPGPF